MNTPTKTHNAKNTPSQISPNAILAYSDRNLNIGASGATILLKKKIAHKIIKKIPTLYLLIFTVDLVYFLLLATTIE
jgi:hypothetical protein